MKYGMRRFPQIRNYEEGSSMVVVDFQGKDVICVVEPRKLFNNSNYFGNSAYVTGRKARYFLKKGIQTVPFPERDEGVFKNLIERESGKRIDEVTFWN